MSDSDPVIAARGLTKRFGQFEAVKGIDFSIERGRCIGLLGPNGAGKTTTMRMIRGLSTVTEGDLRVFGVPIHALSRQDIARIGLVPQDDNLDPDLTARMNLEVYGAYFGLSRATTRRRVLELLDFMQLTEKSEARVNQLSGGMKRRLIIARALMGSADLVILDEPTTGLDPQARVLIWKRLLALKNQGRTLLLTTHYMDEAQRLCERIIIIDEVAKPLPESLDASAWEHEDIGDSVVFYVESVPDFAQAAPKNMAYLHRPANLEDVFLRLTGRALRDS